MFNLKAKTAYDSFKRVLVDNDYAVLTATEFANTGNTNVYWVEFISSITPDVIEMASGRLTVWLHYRHTFNDDSDLLEKLDEVETLYHGYVLKDGSTIEAKGCKLLRTENFVEDIDSQKFVAVMVFEIEL
jgi:hypothetical protein